MQTNRQQLFQNSNPHDVESVKRKYKSVVESCLFLQCQLNAACVVEEHDRKYILLVLPNKASVQILTISGTHAHAFMFRCVLSVLGEISRIISVADPVRQRGGGGVQELFSGGNAKQSEQICGEGLGPAYGPQKAPGFLMLKYAFFHILDTLFLSFLTPSSTPKTDKNRTLHCTSINLRYLYVITHFAKNLHFLIFMKKLCLSLFNLSRYTK